MSVERKLDAEFAVHRTGHRLASDERHPSPDRPDLGVKRTKAARAEFCLSGVCSQG